MATAFQAESLRFLRGLAKHNERDWFEARRNVYESALKAPMLAVIEEINQSLGTFAPEHVRPAHKCMMRIYRDTRFSKDKRPYKRHLSAWWSRRGMEKTSGGGFYLQLGTDEVVVAAGVYMPGPEQLLAVRRWMSANHAAYRKLLSAASRQPRKSAKAEGLPVFAAIAPDALTRMPRGFAADDPAGELVRAKNWGVWSSLPAERALESDFSEVIAAMFRRGNPVVSALNEAVLTGGSAVSTHSPSSPRKPLF